MTNEDRGTDALIALQKDHRRVEQLMERALSDPTAFEELRNELTVHAQLEEEIFYPAVREAMAADERDMIDDALADHADVKQMLSELAALSGSEEEYRAALEELQDSVTQHVEEEEDEMFAMARSVMDAAALADLGGRMAERKAELKGQLVGS